jgi:hypothetical protein
MSADPGDPANAGNGSQSDDELERTPLRDDGQGGGSQGGTAGGFIAARLGRALPRLRLAIGRRVALLRAGLAAVTVLLAAVILLVAGVWRLPFGPDVTPGGDPVPITRAEAGPAITLDGYAPHAVGPGGWEQVALPPRSGDTLVSLVNSLVNVPDDPQTLYACTRGPDAPDGLPDEGVLTLWRTRDGGAHWTSLPLPRLVALGCNLTIARDTAARIGLQVSRSSHPYDAPGCSDEGYYLSDDGGDSWMRLTHTTLAPIHTSCSSTFWPAAHHLYTTTPYTRLDVVTRGPGSGVGIVESRPCARTLERSDDEGRTWVRADGDIAGDDTTFIVTQGQQEDTLMAQVYSRQYPGAPLWQSHDAGRSWRHLDLSLVRDDVYFIPTWFNLEGDLRSPSYGYNTDPNWRTFDLRFAQLDADGRSLTLLPSLPVPGVDAKHTGLYHPLGPLPDGRLLAIGATLEKGIPPSEIMNTIPQAIPPEWFAVWSWDPQAAHWQRISSPAADLIAGNCSAGCGLFTTSGRAQTGKSVPATRTYLWMEFSRAPSAPLEKIPLPALYRLALDDHPLM